jgi:hypothetical protein
MAFLRILAAAPLLAGVAYGQIVLGQIDTFQDGLNGDWQGNGNPTNIPNAGPLGFGDHCVGIDTATAPHLAMYNATTWSGDWLTAGVKVVEMDMRNMGAVPLEMRVVLIGTLGTRWTSTVALPLPVDANWHHMVFPITESFMTQVLGSDSYTDVASTVGFFLIRHQSGPPDFRGTGVTSALRLDNIQALPYAVLKPTSFTYFRGSTLTGSLSDLQASDDSRLVMRPGTVFTNSEPAIQVNLFSTCPFNPSELRFNLEALGSASNMTQRILLYNYSTGQYDLKDTTTATLTDSVREVAVTGAAVADYIDGGTREVRARVTYRANTAVFSYPWKGAIDRAFWKAIP